ncbi:MAG: hypothetical protein COB98_05480 [Flavobacteriaceae bacterium]|nr:MAG: hypothetical protein COB98_05480 [Flavobacteriaceae bacterium]
MKEEIYSLFEAYLQGELQGEELESFEKKLEKDTEFKANFMAYTEVEQSLKSSMGHASEEQALRATLNSFRNKENETEKGSVFKLKSYVWMAVAASVLLLFSVYIYKATDTPSYTEYALHQPLETGTRGTLDSNAKAAEKAFNSKDYTTAVKELSVLLAKDRGNVEWQLYYGISLIEIDKIATAVTILGPISSGNSVYKYTAQWYTALGYLKSGKLEWCKGVLEEMPLEAAEFEKAQELLRKL